MNLMLTLIHQEPTREWELDFISIPPQQHTTSTGGKTYQSSIDSRPSKQHSKIKSDPRMQTKQDLSTGFHYIV
jgi:hypothetical protein